MLIEDVFWHRSPMGRGDARSLARSEAGSSPAMTYQNALSMVSNTIGATNFIWEADGLATETR